MKGKILGDKIKERRNYIDWTQQMLADDANVTVDKIRNLEIGRAGTTKKVITNIANSLKIPLEDIFIENYRNTKVIALANNKGGSGKTTVVGNLGYALSQLDNTKVLLIDGDMQMNLTRSYGLEKNQEMSLYHSLITEQPLEGYIQKTQYENIDFVISDYNLASIDLNLFTKTFRETVFSRIIKSILDKGLYDYVLIDTCPTLGYLNYNILNASNYVIVPVELSAFGIDGLEPLMEFFNTIKVVNPDIEVAGVLRTKVDKRESITPQIEEELSDIFKNKVFKNYIPIDINVKKSQLENKPIMVYNNNSRASKSYKALVKEVIAVVK